MSPGTICIGALCVTPDVQFHIVFWGCLAIATFLMWWFGVRKG